MNDINPLTHADEDEYNRHFITQINEIADCIVNEEMFIIVLLASAGKILLGDEIDYHTKNVSAEKLSDILVDIHKTMFFTIYKIGLDLLKACLERGKFSKEESTDNLVNKLICRRNNSIINVHDDNMARVQLFSLDDKYLDGNLFYGPAKILVVK